MLLPTNISTGQVEGQFLVNVIDGADGLVDGNTEPDALPAVGTVTFTASVPYLPDPAAAPNPATILMTPIVAVLDDEGYLCTPVPGTLDPMYRHVRLIATDDPDASVTGWTWTATYDFATVGGVPVDIEAHSFAVPAGSSLDLTTAVKVPSSAGLGTEQIEALAAAATAAATAAAASAAQAEAAATVTDGGVATLLADPATESGAAVAALVTDAGADKLDESAKGAPNGVAPLGVDSRVPDANLPARLTQSALTEAFAENLEAERGAPNGVASLDEGGKIPTAQVPTASSAVENTIPIRNSGGQINVLDPVNPLHTVNKQWADAQFGKKVSKTELGLFNVRDYGALGNGIADDKLAIQAAIDAAAAAGGGTVYFPAGTYNVSVAVSLEVSNIHFRGTGRSSVVRVPPGNATNNTLIRRTVGSWATPGSAPWISNIVVADLQFEGRWSEFPTSAGGAGLFLLWGIDSLRIERCVFKNSRFFGIGINACMDVTVTESRFENICRDACAVWGTPRVSVTNNRILHNDDDGISINYEASAFTGPAVSQIIVTGNHLTDTGAIRTQSPKGVVIANNTVERSQGTGINLTVRNFTDVDNSTGHSNIVANNVVRDVIDKFWFVDGSSTSANLRSYIVVDSIPAQAGTLAKEPGQIDPATGTAVAPYGYNYNRASLAGSNPLRRPHGVLVTGNICKRTLPAVAKYSDWGYGQGFTMDGWRDHPVTDEHLRGAGVRMMLPLKDVVVSNNILSAGRWGVYLAPEEGVTVANGHAQGIRILNNTIRDFDTIGIGWTESTLTHHDIIIEGNILDGDPHHTAPARVAGGSWSSPTVPYGLSVSNMGGAIIARNVISNVGRTLTNSNASTFQDVIGNLIIADPAGVGYNAGNKGVGDIPSAIGNGAQWWLIMRDCNPTSATYGQSLGATPQNATGVPTSGKWVVGQFVASRSTTINAGKMAIGWMRLTTGTSHVVGTDWSPLYATTT